MSTYQTFNFGGKTIEQPNVKTAVSSFYRRHERLPDCIAVHPTQAQPVNEHLQALALNIPIVKSGGVLANELWLEISNTKDTGEESNA